MNVCRSWGLKQLELWYSAHGCVQWENHFGEQLAVSYKFMSILQNNNYTLNITQDKWNICSQEILPQEYL